MGLEYAEKYDVAGDVAGSIIGKVKNYALSSSVDVVTSLYNSLPFTPEVKTEDVLSAVDKDALAFYKENSDTVQTTSLLAGSLLPGAVTLKLLGRARAGLTSLGYSENLVGGIFTGARQTKIAEEISSIYSTSGVATAEYKAAVRKLYMTTAAQQIMDNAIVEVAVTGAMNAHPYMEDYFKDYAANAAIGTTIGGVLGIGFAVPGARRMVLNNLGEIASGIHNEVHNAYKPVDNGFPASARFQMHSQNVTNLDELARDQTQLPITRSIAEHYKMQEAAAREEALQHAAGFLDDFKVEVKGKTQETPQYVEIKNQIAQLLSDPRFLGVDKIMFYDLNKSVRETAKALEISATGKNTGLLQQLKQGLVDIKANVGLVDNTFVTPEGKKAMAFVRLSTGEIFAAEGVRNAAWAVDIADIGTKLKLKQGDLNKVHLPHNGFDEDNLLRGISAADANARILYELRMMDNLKSHQYDNIVVAPGDVARMNGLVALADKLGPDASQLKVRLRSDMPTYNQIQKFLEAAVSPDYEKQALAISSRDDLSVYKQRLGDRAHILLRDWLGGGTGQAQLRRAMEHYQRGTALAASDSPANRTAAEEIWNAGEGTRRAFKQIADGDGYVYLYRGTRGEVKGHSAVESYSTRANVSKNFGTVRLYRVHTDNIIGSIRNDGFNEHEILVGAPHNQIVDSIPIQTGATKEVHIAGAGTDEFVKPEDFARLHGLMVEQQMMDMLKQGFSIEEMSARLAVTKDGVKTYMSGGSLNNMQKEGNTEWRMYTDPNKIDDTYLHPKNKLYAAIGNPDRNQHAEQMAGLDYKQQRVAHTEIVTQKTLISGSEIGGEALDIYNQPHMQIALDDMLNQIGQINNINVSGRTFLQSADQALRNIKSSPVITWLGKQVIDKSDRMTERMLTGVANNFVPLRDNAAALAEFSSVVNKMRGIEGWRDLKLDPTTNKYTVFVKNKKGEDIVWKDAQGKGLNVEQPEVIAALESMRKPSGELLRLHNLIRDITGQSPVNDTGFYVPPLSLVNKSYAYVVDNSGKTNVRLLVANNEGELTSLVSTFKSENIGNKNLEVVLKGDQKAHNLIKGYVDYETHVGYANVAMQKKGATELGIVPSDNRFLEGIMQSYQNLILNGFRKYSETYMHDVTSWLDRLSAYHTSAIDAQPKRFMFKEDAVDSANVVKNILLGRDQLEGNVAWKAANDFVGMNLNRAYTAVNNFISTQGKLQTKAYYDGLVKTLEDKGVKPIWKSFDEYLTTTRADAKNVAPNIVSTGNGLMATLQLRLFEVAQAAVNIMSLPILTWGALMDKMPHTVLNADGGGIKFPLRAMHDGIRHMFSEEGLRIEKELWEPRGLVNQTVRQFTETVGALKQAYQGGAFMDKALNIANSIQNNKVVTDFLSKPSDWAEKFTRRYAMHTGFAAAKKAYPGIDDLGATIAATSFTDRAIGNYHAAQRPTAFQGTLGSALGLYQTYFLTWAQQVYRGIEQKNFAQLAALAGTQAGIFGMASWPGFNTMSEKVVSHFNDQHYDLTTGTFRAVQNKDISETILYGLPSSLGPAFYTRGDISPRIPGSMLELAVVNGLTEGWKAAYNVAAGAVKGIGQGTPVESLFEALSLQSLNRPIARWSELVTGNSVTKQGNTVSPVSDVWTPVGVMARLLATRPIEEQVTRNAKHLDTYYHQLNHEHKQDAVLEMKQALRNGSLDADNLSHTAEKYLRSGGTAVGWRSAVNETLLKTQAGTRMDMLKHLEPNSPLHYMINDLY